MSLINFSNQYAIDFKQKIFKKKMVRLTNIIKNYDYLELFFSKGLKNQQMLQRTWIFKIYKSEDNLYLVKVF